MKPTLSKSTFSKSILFSLLLCLLIVNQTVYAEVRLAINSPRGELVTLKDWIVFSEYLSALLKETIRIVPLSSIKLVKTVQNKQADFVLANPIQTILLQRNPGYKPLLSMVTKEGKYYAGVIAVSKDSQIKTSEDLRGKKVIGMGKNSAGGHFFQVYHLQQRGINAYRDLAKFAFARNQDEALLALKVGQYDAAFVRTGMIENGLFDPDLFHLVDIRHDPDFNLPHSTALYPEWYVSAAPNTSPELQEKLTAVLKSIKPQQAAAKSTGLQGFIDPLPMHDVEQIVNSLSLH